MHGQAQLRWMLLPANWAVVGCRLSYQLTPRRISATNLHFTFSFISGAEGGRGRSLPSQTQWVFLNAWRQITTTTTKRSANRTERRRHVLRIPHASLFGFLTHSQVQTQSHTDTQRCRTKWIYKAKRLRRRLFHSISAKRLEHTKNV